MIGVDEAGKGPVLGSMFVVAFSDLGRPEYLEKIGVEDSKNLSPEKREEITHRLKDEFEHSVVEVSAEEITQWMSDNSTTMNDLMVDAHRRALRNLGLDIEGEIAVLDASDTYAERFARRVASEIDNNLEIEAEHGADETYPAVSAASILAKVERDRHIAEYDAGSGYPNDPETLEFLREYVKENGELPDIARESWSTAQRVLEEEKQAELGDF